MNIIPVFIRRKKQIEQKKRNVFFSNTILTRKGYSQRTHDNKIIGYCKKLAKHIHLTVNGQ